jgi:hypothetical protein
MKTINKLTLAFFLLTAFFVSAQPPSPGSGNGSNGTGAPASPVDMYLYILAVVAIILIVRFSKKYIPKKI